jgi:hypothetical protein
MSSTGLDTSRPGATDARAVALGGGSEEPGRVEVEARQHEEPEQRRPAEQQRRLHDLHPGGGEHAAEEHVHDHRRARDRDGGLEGQPEEQPDQAPRPHHLGDQVQDHRGERAERRRHAHRHGPEAQRHHVGEGVAAEVAQRLRDQEQHHGPADQPASGVDEPVEAGGGDEPGDAQEARRAHVVAGQGEAVLAGGHPAARRVEVIGGARAPRRPPGDRERDRDEREEEAHGDEVRPAEHARA